MADASPVSGEELKRAEEFAREPFVLEGEEPDQALAKGTERRQALAAVEAVAGPEAELGEAAQAMLAQLRTTLGLKPASPVPVGYEAAAMPD